MVKSKELAVLVKAYPESAITALVNGAETVQFKRVEIANWTDGRNPASFYTDKEVKSHERQGNSIGPLRRLKHPQIRLVLSE